MSTDGRLGPVTVLVGGVGELYQGDLDFGRRVVEQLVAEDLGAHVAIEDLHYGGVAVAQRIEELGVSTVVLVGATVRDRPPATVERRRYWAESLELTPEQLQAAVTDAVTGYVTVDLVVEVAHALGVLPARVVAVDVEPVRTGSDDRLSDEVVAVLDDALDMVRAEVRRAPLFHLADRVSDSVFDGHLAPSPALDAVRSLLDELHRLDEVDRWGGISPCRDRLKEQLRAGQAPPGMQKLDWGLWWNLIEEIDRVQRLESVPG